LPQAFAKAMPDGLISIKKNTCNWTWSNNRLPLLISWPIEFFSCQNSILFMTNQQDYPSADKISFWY
jgi:hypothetical protein